VLFFCSISAHNTLLHRILAPNGVDGNVDDNMPAANNGVDAKGGGEGDEIGGKQCSQPSRPSGITQDGDGTAMHRPSKGKTETVPSVRVRTGTDGKDGRQLVFTVPGRQRSTSMDLSQST